MISSMKQIQQLQLRNPTSQHGYSLRQFFSTLCIYMCMRTFFLLMHACKLAYGLNSYVASDIHMHIDIMHERTRTVQNYCKLRMHI